jgi:hypothetical protein
VRERGHGGREGVRERGHGGREGVRERGHGGREGVRARRITDIGRALIAGALREELY